MELSGSDGNPLGWRLGRYPPATRGPDACGMRPLSLRNRMFNFVSSQLNLNHHVCLVATVSESLGGQGVLRDPRTPGTVLSTVQVCSFIK